MSSSPSSQHAPRPGVRWVLYIIVPLLAAAAAWGCAQLMPKQYSAGATVSFNRIDYGQRAMNLEGFPLAAIEAKFADAEAIREVVTSRGLDKAKGITEGDLKRRLRVSVPRHGATVELSLTMDDPQLAADVLNQLADVCARRALDAMREPYDAMLAKLATNVTSAQAALRQAELAVAKSAQPQDPPAQAELRLAQTLRDQAAATLAHAQAEYDKVRDVPLWPPYRLNIVAASAAGASSSPRPELFAAAALVGAAVVTWGWALLRPRKRFHEQPF
jgi:hypothetical protein